MIISPESNVKFTDEQTKAIELAQGRLVVIQNEFLIAQKALKQANSDTLATTKERLYQEELLAKLEESAKPLEEKLSTLRSQVIESEDILKTNIENARIVGEENEKLSASLTKRESVVSELESSLKDKEKDLNIKLTQLSEEQLKIAKAKDAFSKAIETVSWK